MVKLFNAFSLQMLDNMNATVNFEVVDAKVVANLLADGFVSFVGHADTANVIGNMLGVNVPFVRGFGKIDTDDIAIIAQVVGGRLPLGATTLPDGMQMVFVKAAIV